MGGAYPVAWGTVMCWANQSPCSGIGTSRPREWAADSSSLGAGAAIVAVSKQELWGTRNYNEAVNENENKIIIVIKIKANFC